MSGDERGGNSASQILGPDVSESGREDRDCDAVTDHPAAPVA